MDNYSKLTVRESTREMVMKDCKEEFLRHFPQFNGMHLSQDFMTRKIAEYFLDKLR